MLLRVKEPADDRGARVLALEQRAPARGVSGGEAPRQLGLECRPAVALALRHLLRIDLEQLEQPGVELRLDRADRDVAATGRRADLVEVRAAVEHVGAGRALPHPSGAARV